MSFTSIVRTLFTLGKGVLKGLPAASESANPIDLFGEWYRAASETGMLLPEAMTLATVSEQGVPSARMVLLKSFDEGGFTFYTNYGSRKALELEANPRAALVIHWALLQRQVRIEGSVMRVSEKESDSYFATRPRGSQLGAWASDQSTDLPDRSRLVERFRESKARFEGASVPRPPYWGGFRVAPERMEFWQGRSDRLHDRLVFVRGDGGWDVSRLYP